MKRKQKKILKRIIILINIINILIIINIIRENNIKKGLNNYSDFISYAKNNGLSITKENYKTFIQGGF